MPVLTNVFLVQNAEDGLSGASLRYIQVLLIEIEIELMTTDFLGQVQVTMIIILNQCYFPGT